MFVNASTFVPVLVPLAPAAGLVARFPAAMGEVLGALGVDPRFVESESTEMRSAVLAKTASRQVLGVTNDFALMAEHTISTDRSDPADLWGCRCGLRTRSSVRSRGTTATHRWGCCNASSRLRWATAERYRVNRFSSLSAWRTPGHRLPSESRARAMSRCRRANSPAVSISSSTWLRGRDPIACERLRLSICSTDRGIRSASRARTYVRKCAASPRHFRVTCGLSVPRSQLS